MPFQCYSGVVEKKASHLALSVWFPSTPGLSSKPIPHPYSQRSPKTIHCTHAINQLLQLNMEKISKQSTTASKCSSKHGSQHGENHSPKMYQRTIPTNVGRQQHVPGNGSIGRLTQTIPVCETAENGNGPSQQIVDGRAWLSVHCISRKTKKILVCEDNEYTMVHARR